MFERIFALRGTWMNSEGFVIAPGRQFLVSQDKDGDWIDCQRGGVVTAHKYTECGLVGVELKTSCVDRFCPDDGECERVGMQVYDNAIKSSPGVN